MTFNALKLLFDSALATCYHAEEASEIFFILLQENNNLSRIEFAQNRSNVVENELNWKSQIERLTAKEPMQYVLGFADFWGLKIGVSPAVLIPRPETEELVKLILDDLDKNATKHILDLGTGSGCIALALKNERPNANVFGLDVSEAAIKVAKQNSIDLNLAVTWILADIKTLETEEKFDIIVSNPPYIPIEDAVNMTSGVLDFEPHLALFAPKNDPLFFYRIIGDFAQKALIKPGGKLYFEAHHIYANHVFAYFAENANAKLVTDMFGKPRFIEITF